MINSRSYLLPSGAAVAALLLFAPLAAAQDARLQADADDAPARGLAPGLQFGLRLEPGLAAAVTDPQGEITEAGFASAVKLMFGVTPYLEIGPSGSFTTLPAASPMTDSGTAWTVGGGARLMRPHDAAPGRRGIHAISPWVDADVLYVRTGGLNRPGFSAAAGLAMPIDDDRRFWIGPFVRYFHINQGERTGFDNRDAQIISVGISLEVGSGLEKKRRAPVESVADILDVEEATPEPVAVVEPAPPTDRDGDGIFDDDDHCPDVAGKVETSGCPPYEKVVVLRDRLEVKEKIAFRWDSAELEDSSYPVLDDVVRALQDNQAFSVEVGGHASSDGEDAHNQTLSEARAATVLDYLAAHGVARERLVSKGFSSSVPVADNDTADGRETNRRVEFVVHFTIVNDGSSK